MVFSIFLSVFVVQAQQSVRLSVSPAGMTPGVGDTFHIIIDIQILFIIYCYNYLFGLL